MDCCSCYDVLCYVVVSFAAADPWREFKPSVLILMVMVMDGALDGVFDTGQAFGLATCGTGSPPTSRMSPFRTTTNYAPYLSPPFNILRLVRPFRIFLSRIVTYRVLHLVFRAESGLYLMTLRKWL